MEYGVCIPHYGRLLDGPALRDVAQAAEGLGYDALWATDHIVVPADTELIYRNDMLECLSVLNYVAAATQRVRLGTSVLILPYRNPLVVAKAMATADVLSGGRVIMGAAVGWLEEEFIALGARFHERGRYTDEALRIIKELWTSERPSFEGRYYRFSGLAFSPRPVQRPHPPIWIGGNSEGAMRRAVAYGEAWHLTRTTPEQAKEQAERLRQMAASMGRERPPALSVRATVGMDGAGGSSLVRGSAEEVAAAMRRYGTAGVTHVALMFEAAGAADTIHAMERFAGEVVPQTQKSTA